jgi:hypothetical protein
LMFEKPSSNEYSVCTWRWAKDISVTGDQQAVGA